MMKLVPSYRAIQDESYRCNDQTIGVVFGIETRGVGRGGIGRGKLKFKVDRHHSGV
jgi:hypothetical protein